MALYLMPVKSGRPIVLDKAVIFIGRHPECDVVIKHSRKVSRKHCCLAIVDSRLVIRDLGSMNGIRVNGRRVRKETSLKVGDEVTIGDVAYAVRDATTPVSAPPDAPTARTQRTSPPAPPRPAAPRKPPALPVDISQEYPVPLPDEDEIEDLEPNRDSWKEERSADSSEPDEPIMLSDSSEHSPR